jgi:hypothetical protein
MQRSQVGQKIRDFLLAANAEEAHFGAGHNIVR